MNYWLDWPAEARLGTASICSTTIADPPTKLHHLADHYASPHTTLHTQLYSNRAVMWIINW